MLLNHIFPFTKEKLIKKNLLIFQNIYALFICYNSLYSVYTWRNTGNVILLINTTKYFKDFLLVDLLLCSNDIYIHHIAGLLISYVSFKNTMFFNETVVFYTSIIYCVELSTLFLIFNSLFKQFQITNMLTNINDILFLITFIYTRIYLYPKYLILDNNFYDILSTLSLVDNYIITISIYTLYILNLYWFSIMLKKIIKPINKLSSLNCEKILKYTYGLSVVGSLILYRPYQNILFSIDIVGQGLLCITSYEYHYSLEQELVKIPENKVDILNNHIIWKYLNDIICIHIRCFCCILVHTNLFDQINNINQLYRYISFILHFISVYHHIKFITKLKNNRETFYLTEHGTYKNNVINYLSGLPILLDTLICLTNSNFYARTNLLIITFLIYILSYIRPLYNMTHLGLHILLFFQTLILCQSNIVVNI